MPGWFTSKTAGLDLLVAAGALLGLAWWFGEVLHASGLLAVYASIFALFQVLRFVNAQLAALEWVKMHEAILVEKKDAPVRARRDGYREAAVVEEPPSVEDELLAREVPRRRRNARLGLGIVGALGYAAMWLPGFLSGMWWVPGVMTFVAIVCAVMLVGIRRTRQAEGESEDFFMQNLERDTQKVLHPREPARVRVGVDFGVPATELAADEAPDETEVAPRAKER